MNKLSEEDKRDAVGWFVALCVFGSGLLLFIWMAEQLGGLDHVSWQNIWEWINE